MADLDDFFAKKDKKKKDKSKSKFLTAEELVKNLEDTSRREAAAAATAKSKKPEPTAPAAGVTNTVDEETIAKAIVEQPPLHQQQEPTEEEWKEFEEEQRKDYTGLKIGQLTINDEEEQSSGEGEEEDVDSEGNSNTETGKRGSSGPWKKVIPAEEVTQIPMEAPSSKYISPALRQSQLHMPGSRLKPNKRAAPDITNADFFPTLGAARPEEQRKKKNEPAFEEVRHGGRVQRIQEQPSAAPVSVANRFQSLDEDDS